MTFPSVRCFAGSHCWRWWHWSVSHLVLGQRRHLRPPLHLTSLDLHFGSLRHQLISWNVVTSSEILSCACVHPQECCVKMVTNGIIHEKRQPGGLRKGIGERITGDTFFLVIEFVVRWLKPTVTVYVDDVFASVVWCTDASTVTKILHPPFRARSVIGRETLEQLAKSTSALHVDGHECEVCAKTHDVVGWEG